MTLDPPSDASRTHLSFSLLESAVSLAQQASVQEKDLPAFVSRYVGFSTGAIFTSVAFMEAAINEVFCDAVDGHPRFPEAPLFTAMWKLGLDRFKVLDKFQAALSLAGQQCFDIASEPWQSAQDLVALRNHLVHYKPQWLPDEPGPGRIDKRLKDKFPASPIHPRGAPLAPLGVLCSGCASWAVRSGGTLAIEFFNRLGPGRLSYARTAEEMTKTLSTLRE